MKQTASAAHARDETKAELRRQMNGRREALSPLDAARLSETICSRIVSLPDVSSARTVALYAPIRNEVDLRKLGRALRQAQKVVAYPRIESPAKLGFYQVDDDATLVPQGLFQIPEPPADAPKLELSEIELMLVPGLAFDAHGYRVGWGAGFYDVILPQARNAKRLGACYDFQLIAVCPHSEADQRVDFIVTESRTLERLRQTTPPDDAPSDNG